MRFPRDHFKSFGLTLAIISLVAFSALTMPTTARADQAQTKGSTCSTVTPGTEQAAAVDEIRSLGQAIMAWLADQVGRGVTVDEPLRGAGSIDLTGYSDISPGDLEMLLVPDYLDCVPTNDPWGNPYDYWLDTVDLLGSQTTAIRSSGANGVTIGPIYTLGAFPGDDLDQDIVWADGVFARFPDPTLLSILDFETGDL